MPPPGRRQPDDPDPFATDQLRARVLAAWSASPARFREDANAEEDFALGGYRDRLVVELAQNAADAATRGGRPGRLALVLRSGELTAANTGAPLDSAGVESLSTLRASAKRDQPTVGRFGVGFAAVLAVSDEPAVVSTTGAVRWSRAETFTAVEALPALREELAARGGQVPVLRLPLPSAGTPPAGFDTAVALPLRDSAAEQTARWLLSDLDPTLLLLLPGLAELTVEVDGRLQRFRAHRIGNVVQLEADGTTTRWRLAGAGGSLDARLLADRPAEERARPVWSITWAVPVSADDVPRPLLDLAAVVRAPTPTDEPMSLPAVLAGSFPLDPSRRHVAPGPLTDFLVARAAQGYADLLAELPASPALLSLVPVAIARGELDAALRRAVLAELAETPILPTAADPASRLRPRDAVAVDDPLVPVLRDVVPGLLAAGFTGGDREAALAVLGARRPTLVEVVEALAGLDREPGWWLALYRGLDAAVPPGTEREALGALPVPLADGGLALGPRGLLLAGDRLAPSVVAGLGLRVVHPDASHPLLTALGALPATPRSVLGEPRVQAAVAGSYEADDPAPLAAAVLELVAAAEPAPGELPWLAELALPGDDGEWYPAGELLLPGGRLARLVVPDAPFGFVEAALLERWGAATLTAVGVLESFALVSDRDVLGPDHDLDGESEWWSGLPAGAAVAELTAVRDLELVAAAAWPQALALLAEPPPRAAVIEPVTVLLPDGTSTRRPSYTAWWLADHPVLAGLRPLELRDPEGDPRLHSLYDAAPPGGVDATFRRGIGLLTSLEETHPDDVLDRLADPGRGLEREQVRALHAWLADQEVTPPERVRAVRAGRVTVVAATDAVIVDAPDLLPLVGDRAVVPAPLAAAVRLADTLDLPLASELSTFPVRSAGRRSINGDIEYDEHDPLLVTDADGSPVRVAWRWLGGRLHVDAARREVGLGRGLAWASGRWWRRHALTEALRQPDAADELAAEADLD